MNILKRKIGIIIVVFFFFLFGVFFQRKSFPSKMKNIILRTLNEKFYEKKADLEFTQPDSFKLLISNKDIKALQKCKENVLKKLMLSEEDEIKFSGILVKDLDSIKVKIKPKGRLADHFSTDLISLKIKVKEKNDWNQISTFSIQHPKTRSYINEWLFHKIMKELGVIALTYDFVLVEINNSGKKLYAIEEKFDKNLLMKNDRKNGPIFKFDNDIYFTGRREGLIKHRIDGTEILPYNRSELVKDSLLFNSFEKAKKNIEKYKRNLVKTSDIFDVKILANYFAVFDLLGYHHGTSLDNMKFYFNPESELLEPIPYDNQKIQDASIQEILGFYKQIGKNILPQEINRWKHCKWYELVFKDSVFYKAYVNALTDISKTKFLDSFFEKNNRAYINKINTLKHYYPQFNENIKKVLYSNQDYVKRCLDPSEKAVQGYYVEHSNNKIKLQVRSMLGLPIHIIGLFDKEGNKISFSPSNVLIQAVRYGFVAESIEINFEVNSHELDKENVSRLKLRFSVLGLDKEYESNIRPWKDN